MQGGYLNQSLFLEEVLFQEPVLKTSLIRFSMNVSFTLLLILLGVFNV